MSGRETLRCEPISRHHTKKLDCKAYRAIGNALNKNPYSDVPCFKIVKNDGSLGGFALGSREKIRRLSKEGILVKNGKIIDFEKKLFRF